MPNIESGDWSIPSFKFSEAERGKLRENHSDEEINQMEARKNLDLAEEKLRQEMDSQDRAA